MSPVTYSIANLFKRVFVILVAIAWFGQSVSAPQWLGIVLTFVGLYLYNSAKTDAPPPRGAEPESLPMHMRSPPLSTTLPPRPPPIENT